MKMPDDDDRVDGDDLDTHRQECVFCRARNGSFRRVQPPEGGSYCFVRNVQTDLR